MRLFTLAQVYMPPARQTRSMAGSLSTPPSLGTCSRFLQCATRGPKVGSQRGPSLESHPATQAGVLSSVSASVSQ